MELFEAVDDPVATAENESLESQMHEAQQQQFAEVNDVDAFEVLQHASHVSDSSSIAGNDNRSAHLKQNRCYVCMRHVVHNLVLYMLQSYISRVSIGITCSILHVHSSCPV